MEFIMGSLTLTIRKPIRDRYRLVLDRLGIQDLHIQVVRVVSKKIGKNTRGLSTCLLGI